MFTFHLKFPSKNNSALPEPWASQLYIYSVTSSKALCLWLLASQCLEWDMVLPLLCCSWFSLLKRNLPLGTCRQASPCFCFIHSVDQFLNSANPVSPMQWEAVTWSHLWQPIEFQAGKSPPRSCMWQSSRDATDIIDLISPCCHNKIMPMPYVAIVGDPPACSSLDQQCS